VRRLLTIVSPQFLEEDLSPCSARNSQILSLITFLSPLFRCPVPVLSVPSTAREGSVALAPFNRPSRHSERYLLTECWPTRDRHD